MSDSDGVRQVLDQFLEALNSGDGETAAKLHSQADDAITIGSDPDEWFQGGEAIHRVFAEMVGGGPSGMTARVDEPLVGAEGDVGWYASRGAFITPDGKEVPFRASGVTRREGGEWRIFQSHTSIGVPNDEAFAG
jgi:ketosteroid isomerase-like protein